MCRRRSAEVAEQDDERLGSEPRALHRVEGRELARQTVDEQLEDPLGPVEPLQAMSSEISEANTSKILVIDESCRRSRQQHLSPVTNRADSRSTVNADSDVPALPGMRLG